MTTTPERHLIKKYANRKLYETRTSRYITLEGIAEFVRDGHERDLKTENLNRPEFLGDFPVWFSRNG